MIEADVEPEVGGDLNNRRNDEGLRLDNNRWMDDYRRMDDRGVEDGGVNDHRRANDHRWTHHRNQGDRIGTMGPAKGIQPDTPPFRKTV